MKKLLLLLLLPLAAFAQGGPTNKNSGAITAGASTCGVMSANGPSSNGACVGVDISPNNGALVVQVKGTYAAVLGFWGDPGSGIPATVQCTATDDVTSTSTGPTNTEGTWQCPTAGLVSFFVRASAYTSGTANIYLQSSNSTVRRSTPGSGSGTVTSIAMDAPLGGTSNPITGSGTITCTTCVWSSTSLVSGEVVVGTGAKEVTSDADLSFNSATDTLSTVNLVVSGTCGGCSGNPSLTEHYVGFGSATNTITGNAGFTFDPAGPVSLNLSTAQSLGTNEALTVIQAVATVIGSASNIGVNPLTGGADISGTVGQVNGSTGSIYLQPSAVATTVRSFQGVSYIDDMAVVDTFVGLDLVDDIGAATVSNWYGIRVGDISGATSNYAIKTGAGKVQFGDDVYAGSTGAWKDVHAANFVLESSSINPGTTTAHAATVSAYDVDDMVYRDFITWTNGNTPSMVIDAPSGGTLTINTGGGAVTSGGAGKGNGQIKIAGNVAGTITVTTASTTDTWSWTLPTDNGDANQYLMTDGSGVSSWNSLPFNAVWSLPGAPGDSTTYPVFVATSGLSFPDNWSGSTCKVLTNATATWTATVKKNGSSVGTVAVATNGTCTFDTTGGATTFSSGDYMTLTTPTADATLADVMFDFVATRT